MFSIKRGDTKEPLQIQLSDESGNINLTGCSVRFLMSDWRQQNLIVDGEAEIRDAVNGIVWYVFQSADVENVGIYKGEFEVTYPDFKTETFPSAGYLLITINKDLG